jgi:hypothetical protein
VLLIKQNFLICIDLIQVLSYNHAATSLFLIKSFIGARFLFNAFFGTFLIDLLFLRLIFDNSAS